MGPTPLCHEEPKAGSKCGWSERRSDRLRFGWNPSPGLGENSRFKAEGQQPGGCSALVPMSALAVTRAYANSLRRLFRHTWGSGLDGIQNDVAEVRLELRAPVQKLIVTSHTV